MNWEAKEEELKLPLAKLELEDGGAQLSEAQSYLLRDYIAELEAKAAKYDILADALKVICDPHNWDGIYMPRIDCQTIAEHALLEATK